MKIFDNGIEWYDEFKLELPIFFPEGEICCWYCPMFNKFHEECILTSETIKDPKNYTGRLCKLVPTGDGESITD